MAGRLAYMAMCGAAILGGMALQGDLNFNDRDESRIEVSRVDRTVDRSVDRTADRAVERSVARAEQHQREAAVRSAMSAAIAELARAEGNLISLKIDEQVPAAVIRQAEDRRNAARAAVDQIAADARADTNADRDALREQIRDEVRQGIRDAVRS